MRLSPDSHSVETLVIEPGSSRENSYIESINGKMRDELLAREIFYSLKEAPVMIEMWMQQYNTIWPIGLSTACTCCNQAAAFPISASSTNMRTGTNYGGRSGLATLITGIIALVQIKENAEFERGNAIAIAGMVLGILNCLPGVYLFDSSLTIVVDQPIPSPNCFRFFEQSDYLHNTEVDMTDLDKYLNMLKSPKASVRCDACEELRVATESNPEVILALEEAAEDEHESVAERARPALKAESHQQMVRKMGSYSPIPERRQS